MSPVYKYQTRISSIFIGLMIGYLRKQRKACRKQRSQEGVGSDCGVGVDAVAVNNVIEALHIYHVDAEAGRYPSSDLWPGIEGS